MSFIHPSDYIEDEYTSCGELEGVLRTGNPTNQKNDDLQSLLRKQPKYFTVVPKAFMLYGAYNKINYTADCYKACLMTNNEHEPKTKSLLCFGGGFSRFGSCLAFLLLLVFFILPFAAVWPLVVETKKELLIFTTCMEFVLFLWHFYCVYTIKVKNLDVWLKSWFTFSVKTETLQDDEYSAKTHTFFRLRGQLRIIDISVSDLCRLSSCLHQLKATEREKLASVLERHRLEQAVIILYSEKFITNFIKCSMYVIFIIASLSAASTAVLVWKTYTVW